MNRFLFIATIVLGILEQGTDLLAQEAANSRVYKFGEQRVELKVSSKEIVAYPKEEAPEEFAEFANFARETMMAQNRVTKDGFAPQSVDEAVSRKNLLVLDEVGGLPNGAVIVPRATSLDAEQLAGLLGEGGEAAPVYLIGDTGQRAILLDTITVKFREKVTEEELKAIRDTYRLQVTERPKWSETIVRFAKSPETDEDLFAIGDALQERGSIQWAEPDMAFELLLCADERIPNDKLFDKQWYLKSIKLPAAWAVSTGTESVIVAVADDGVDVNHEDLKGLDGEQSRIVQGRDFWDEDDDPSPDSTDAHGTACAGIIAGLTDNDRGIAGIAWNCRIMPLRISGPANFATNRAIADSFVWAEEHGAKVVNCSWGGGLPSPLIRDAIKEVTEKGVLVVVSAGNAVPSLSTFYPARFDECLAVGASQKDNTRFNYSCYGPDYEVDVMAPSGKTNLQGDIVSTDHSGASGYNNGNVPVETDTTGNYTNRFGGTSAAAPVVSGLAALILSTYPDLTVGELREAIEQSCVKIGSGDGSVTYDGNGPNGSKNKRYGYGVIDAHAALLKAEALASATQPTAKLVAQKQPSPTKMKIKPASE